ncbi:MAG TPA: cytochrome c biogenesis protein DipZ [Conexibacter sp.]|jgi:cytochrome c biogenesis protein CcdA/thiol-disulfide isomerase/thioredoxin
MVLLLLFGLIAGAGTAVSPCVLPVLPIVLAAGATGGRRRPLGIVIGLVASFTFATVALVYVLNALGLPNTLLRTVAIVILLAFGAILIVPPLAARLEAYLTRFANATGATGGAASRGDGFGSGVLVGASLGLVYAPCAGPVLAGVITVSAAQPFTAGRLAVALAYAIGSALVLWALMLGGRRLTAPLSRRSGTLQIAMGGVMVIVAIAMLANWDLDFQRSIAKDLPAFLVDPTSSLESSAAARTALASVRHARADSIGSIAGRNAISNGSTSDLRPGRRADLPVLGTAPDFTGTEDWFNTPGDRPLSLSQLRGHVVLVDFWTYSCINCLRTLPYLEAWDQRYRDDGLTIVGVHSPEFPFEKDASNVAAAVKREGIKYPVAQDNDLATWTAWGNQYWPAEYFVDARGKVRFAHFGEGDYAKKERVIRALLAEAGHSVGRGLSGAHGMTASNGITTPESYLGAERAGAAFANGPIMIGGHDYGAPQTPKANQLSYDGRWQIGEQQVIARGGGLTLSFGAKHVYLVLGSPGQPRQVRLTLDGRPLPAQDDGADAHNGVVTVTGQRLYELVDLPRVGHHVLHLQPDDGTDAYSFTFG